MKKIILILIMILTFSKMYAGPLCSTCNPNTYSYSSQTFSSTFCTGCVITVYYWYSATCFEYCLDHIELGMFCNCAIDLLIQEAISNILMNGKLLPQEGFTQPTLMNNFQCFRSINNIVYTCDPTHCCVTEYAVEHLPGHVVTISRDYNPVPFPDLENCYQFPAGACTNACGIDFFPRISINPSDEIPQTESSIKLNRPLYSVDGKNFNLEFIAKSEGRLAIDFYNYIGEKLYSYENFIKGSTLNIESINLAKLKGFAIYNVSFNSKIVFVGKIIIDK